MNAITLFLKNIRNLIPYFLLIAIYFFFVNLEARKNKFKKIDSEKGNILNDDKPSFDAKSLRISIPVIPYK